MESVIFNPQLIPHLQASQEEPKKYLELASTWTLLLITPSLLADASGPAPGPLAQNGIVLMAAVENDWHWNVSPEEERELWKKRKVNEASFQFNIFSTCCVLHYIWSNNTPNNTGVLP